MEANRPAADGGFRSTPTGGITKYNLLLLVHYYILFMDKIGCEENKLV